MTFAELLLILFIIAGIYRLLRPLRQFLELAILKAMHRDPKWFDADIVKFPQKKKE